MLRSRQHERGTSQERRYKRSHRRSPSSGQLKHSHAHRNEARERERAHVPAHRPMSSKRTRPHRNHHSVSSEHEPRHHTKREPSKSQVSTNKPTFFYRDSLASTKHTYATTIINNKLSTFFLLHKTHERFDAIAKTHHFEPVHLNTIKATFLSGFYFFIFLSFYCIKFPSSLLKS